MVGFQLLRMMTAATPGTTLTSSCSPTKFGLQAISPGYESDMPAFETVLSDAQIVQVFDYIKSTWPERARKYQAARSKADP